MGLFHLCESKHDDICDSYKDYMMSPAGDEKLYYQEDSYYTSDGVITFEERRRTAIPSRNGLYPAEILLLEYCSKGQYPHPKHGYQSFWWFQYGIRNVGAALDSLENRGFIALASVKDSIKSFTAPQLKELLKAKGCTATGKKSDLVARVAEYVPDEDLFAAGLQLKYVLTETGKQELQENEYVPYMHRAGGAVDVWTINRMLSNNSEVDWKAYVEEQTRIYHQNLEASHQAFLEGLREDDPDGYRELKAQDDQIAIVQQAQAQYELDHNLDSYIIFWENIWNNGGLLFEGIGWHFKLADLYIKAERYDDALAFVKMIKKTKDTYYSNRANSLIAEIEKLKAKQK